MIVPLVDMLIKRDSAIAALAGVEHILKGEELQPNLNAGTVLEANMLPPLGFHAFHVLRGHIVQTQVCRLILCAM